MTWITVSDLSLFETLEQKLQADVSVSLLAELERELLRIRADKSPAEWLNFCTDLPRRPVFQTLKLGKLTLKRLDSGHFSIPADVLEIASADAFQGRPFAAPSRAHLLSAWEYSLPASRSLRARKAYFHREIGETLRTVVKPRVLILGGGQLHEADDALNASRLFNAEFVAVEPAMSKGPSLRKKYANQQLELHEFDWDELPAIREQTWHVRPDLFTFLAGCLQRQASGSLDGCSGGDATHGRPIADSEFRPWIA